MYKFGVLLIYSIIIFAMGYFSKIDPNSSNNVEELSQVVRMTYMYSCQEQLESYLGKNVQPSEVELKLMNICWIKSENYSNGFKNRYLNSNDLIMSMDGSFYNENKFESKAQPINSDNTESVKVQDFI